MGTLNNKNKLKIKNALFPILVTFFSFVAIFCVNFISSPFVVKAQLTFQTGLVVTGVESTTQYLTSLVLYAEDPDSGPMVTLTYDAETNALLVKGAVNADALIIGENSVFGENNVSFGGSQNTLNGNNSVIIGGTNNVVRGATRTVVVGGTGIDYSSSLVDSAILNSERMGSNVLGNNIVILQGGGGLNVNGKNTVVLGIESNAHQIGNNSFVAGTGNIGPSSALSDVFVWSDGDFQYGDSSAFYANASQGVGLNTSYPLVSFDLGKQGILKTSTTDNLVSGISDCNSMYAGIMAIVRKGTGAAMCGCNGSQWVPLSTNPEQQILCRTSTSVGCSYVLPFVEPGDDHISQWSGGDVQRWFSDINNGVGGRRFPILTYGGTLSLDGTKNVCGYTCKTGYTPGVVNPEGWFNSSCVKCSGKNENGEVTTGAIENGSWKTAGTGVNDCDFQCDENYYYAPLERRCISCGTGERNPMDNQSVSCQRCKTPSAYEIGTNRLLSETGLDPENNYPYFLKFITSGLLNNQYSCKFSCNAGYIAQYSGTHNWSPVSNGGNACAKCSIGYYAPEGSASCIKCDVRPNKIDYQYRIGEHGTWIQGTLDGEGLTRLYYYTSSGTGTSDSCQWKCGSGLLKVGNQCECGDKNNTHLEKVGGLVKCVDNVKEVSCGGLQPTDDDSTLLGDHEFLQGGIGTWKKWTRDTKAWTHLTYADYLGKSEELDACEWMCKPDYTWDGVTGCIAPISGVCNTGYQNTTLDEMTRLSGLNYVDLCLVAEYPVEVTGPTPQGVAFEVTSDGLLKTDGSGNVITSSIKYRWDWVCEGEIGQDLGTHYTSEACYAQAKGEPHAGQCKITTDESGNNKTPGCEVWPEICEEDCPGAVEIGAITHGTGWQCPGAYGGKTMRCGICDPEYVWDEVGYGCKKEKIYTNCLNGSGYSFVDSWGDGYVHGTGRFEQTFSGSLGKYLPETSRTYTGKTINTNADACLFTCKNGDGYENKYEWYNKACRHSYVSTEACSDGDKPGTWSNSEHWSGAYWLSFQQQNGTYEDKKPWTYVPFASYNIGDPEDCTWTCKDGFLFGRRWNQCVPRFRYYSCGTVPGGNVVLGTGRYTQEYSGIVDDYVNLSNHQSWTLLTDPDEISSFKRDREIESDKYACSFVCEEGYTYFNGRCINKPSCGLAINNTGASAIDLNQLCENSEYSGDSLRFLKNKGRYEWICYDRETGLYPQNGAEPDYNPSNKCHTEVIQPKCGEASGVPLANFPSEESLCNSGMTVFTGISNQGNWVWVCVNDVGDLWSTTEKMGVFEDSYGGNITQYCWGNLAILEPDEGHCKYPFNIDDNNYAVYPGPSIDYNTALIGARCSAPVIPACGTYAGVYLEGEDDFSISPSSDEDYCSNSVGMKEITLHNNNTGHIIEWDCTNNGTHKTVPCAHTGVVHGMCMENVDKYKCEVGDGGTGQTHNGDVYTWYCKGQNYTANKEYIANKYGENSEYSKEDYWYSDLCSYEMPQCGSLHKSGSIYLLGEDPGDGSYCTAGERIDFTGDVNWGRWKWKCKNGNNTNNEQCYLLMKPKCITTYTENNIEIFPNGRMYGGTCGGFNNVLYSGAYMGNAYLDRNNSYTWNWRCINRFDATFYVECSGKQIAYGKCNAGDRAHPCKLCYKNISNTEVCNTTSANVSGSYTGEDGKLRWYCDGVNSGESSDLCIATWNGTFNF